MVRGIVLEKEVEYCRARVKGNGERCHKPAGWGTDHPGTGRCKLHGGSSTGPKHGSGLYRERLTIEEQVLYDKLKSEGCHDLSEELVVLKIALSRMLKEVASGEDGWERDLKKKVVPQIEAVSRLMFRQKKLEESTNRLSFEGLHEFVGRLGMIMQESCADCPKRKLISIKLKEMRLTDADKKGDAPKQIADMSGRKILDAEFREMEHAIAHEVNREEDEEG